MLRRRKIGVCGTLESLSSDGNNWEIRHVSGTEKHPDDDKTADAEAR